MWRITNKDDPVVDKIRNGTVTFGELTAAGAVQLGVNSDDYGSCMDRGEGCTDIYAVSIAGVLPSGYMTWFQATAAARNSGKRLPTNAEWQAAALDTPDPGVDLEERCNISSAGPVDTGSRTHCVSAVGAHDMVGNVSEWVADWVPKATDCSASFFNNDSNCMAISSVNPLSPSPPAAIIRGFNYLLDTASGVYAIAALDPPTIAVRQLGFRAAR